MSENTHTLTHTLTAADFADILSTTLALANEAGLIVGVRNATANEKRPAGLMIYISGLTTANGAIEAQALEPAAESIAE